MVGSQSDPLFEEAEIDSAKMTEAMYDWLELRTEDTTIISWCISKIENLPEYLDDSAYFYLDVDGFVDSILIEPTDYQYTNDSTYSYTGQMVGEEGWVSFVAKDSMKTALIFYEGEYMEYIPFLRNTTLCLKYDFDKMDPPECDVTRDSILEASGLVDTTRCQDEACATVIKLLILITPQAEAYLGSRASIATQVSRWIEHINLAFRNSYIPHLIIHELVYYNFTNYDLFDDITKDVTALRNDQNVTSFRDQSKSDIVLLITNKFYSFDGHVGEEVVDPNKAHGIVQVFAADAPSYTLAHETGHLFEAHHERKQGGNPPDPDPEDCSYAWGLSNNMGTILGRYPNVLHYSDPMAKYQNTFQTGDVENNNAGKLRKQGCAVADHRSEKDFRVSIRSTGNLCNVLTLEALVKEPDQGFLGQPPYNYTWERSFTGDFSDGVSLGSTASINFSPCSLFTTKPIFIKVKVISSDQPPIETFLTRKVKCRCSQGTPFNPNHRTRELISSEILFISGVSSSKLYQIEQTLNLPYDQYIVYSVEAKRILDGRITENTVELNLNLNGVYFIQLFNRNGFFTTLKYYHEN